MESKGVVSESNPLIQKDFPVIRGWTVLISGEVTEERLLDLL